MHAIALVVTLAEDGTLAGSAREALGSDPRLALGPSFGSRLPLAGLADSEGEVEELFEQIRQTPGVSFVELIMADYGEDDAQAPAGARCGGGA